MEQTLRELIEKSEQRLKRIKNGWLNDNQYDSEKEWLEDLNHIKGRLEAYKKVLMYLQQSK